MLRPSGRAIKWDLRNRSRTIVCDNTQTSVFVTHHFKLDDMIAAYDTSGRAAETKALKVIIER